MNNKWLLLFIFVWRCYGVSSQLNTTVDTLFIRHVIENESLEVIDESFGEGPWAYGKCRLRNTSQDTIVLVNSYLFIKFFYQNTECQSMPFIVNMEDSLLILNPGDLRDILFGMNLMVYPQLSKSDKYEKGDYRYLDHRKVMDEIIKNLAVVVDSRRYEATIYPLVVDIRNEP